MTKPKRPEPTKFLMDSPMWHYEELEWDKLPIGEIIKFEIINFNKVEAHEKWKGKYGSTSYYIFVAKMFSKITHFCGVDDILIMNVPARTFERALKGVPLVKKAFMRSLVENDNLYLEIEKKSNRNFIIYDLERKSEDEELTKKAGDMYYD